MANQNSVSIHEPNRGVQVTFLLFLIAQNGNWKLQDQFYLMFEREIQIWPKALLKKVTLQRTKMKTYTEAFYACKITKTNNFPSFSDLSKRNWFFSDHKDFIGIPLYFRRWF